SGAPELAIRDGIVFRPRLVRAAPTPRPFSFRADGTTLITGGTGALAASIATHLVRNHGVRRLLLLSRSGPAAPSALTLQDDLAPLGAHVTVLACDVADRAALACAIDGISPEFPLDAVVHAAGVLDDGPVLDLTSERLARVLAPKLDAALHLHELTKDRPLS